jgi:hypothetical protein
MAVVRNECKENKQNVLCVMARQLRFLHPFAKTFFFEEQKKKEVFIEALHARYIKRVLA